MPDPLSEGWQQIVVKLIVPADYMAPLASMIAGDGVASVSGATLLAFNPPGQANQRSRA